MTILTKTTWTAARVFTDAELATYDSKIAEMTTSGGMIDAPFGYGGQKIKDGDTYYRAWTSTEAANEWIAFTNTFTPPPVLNTVITV